MRGADTPSAILQSFLELAEAGCAARLAFFHIKLYVRRPCSRLTGPVLLCPAGKDHVCRFVGCGQNERFTYVVMELQVGFICSPLVEWFLYG